MLFEKYHQLLDRMDYHISNQCTGSPITFANKLNISLRSLHRILSWLRDLGISILYSRSRQTYYYETPGRLQAKIFFEEK